VVFIDAGDFEVSDGTSRELTLSVYLNTSNVVDGSVLQFQVDQTAHGFRDDPALGSLFATDFGADVTSANHTIAVAATKLAFASERPPSVVGIASDFRVEVHATDANGNTDSDSTASVEISKVSGGGTLSSASGLTHELINGTNLWPDVQISSPGVFTIKAEASGLADAVSGSIMAGGFWINEFDYDSWSVDSNEWVEIIGNAGRSLDDYELVMIDQNGAEVSVWDLALANWTFTDETNGYGFFVMGIVHPDEGTADYTPPTRWTQSEIQNGPTDSIQLRNKDGSNVHLVDYDGNNSNTDQDQVTALDDGDDPLSSLYLTGGPGSWFTDFTWANTAGNATPGAVNVGQQVITPRIPRLSATRTARPTSRAAELR